MVVGMVLWWYGLDKDMGSWRGIPKQDILKIVSGYTEDSSCPMNEFNEWINEKNKEVQFEL